MPSAATKPRAAERTQALDLEVNGNDKVPTVYQHDGLDPRASWNMGGDKVTQVTSHYQEEVRDALRWFFNYCVRQAISRTQAAELIKVDQSTIYRVYSGTYTDGKGSPIVPAKMIEHIVGFRRLEEKRASLGRVEFVETPTSKDIWQICDLCAASNRIGTIWGKSQIGKSYALLEYQARHNHGQTKYIRIEPASGTHELMRQLAEQCALSVRTAFDSLKRRVIKAIDRNNLVIIDEIHELAFTYRNRSKLSCVELLRWIHDMTGCGMVICGTNIWRTELEEGKDKLLLEQMERRGVFRLQLPDKPTDGDLRAIFRASGLQWPDSRALEIVREVASRRGLTAMTEFLRFGRKLAGDAKAKLTWAHVEEAYDIIVALERPTKSH